MSIRFCTLDYEEKKIETVEVADFKHLKKSTLYTNVEGKFAEFVSFPISSEAAVKPLCLDENFFINAHDAFYYNDNLKYIPVVDKNNNFLCFCYEDFEIEKMHENVLELVSFNAFRSYSHINLKKRIRIWGFNEIAYHFHIFLEKMKISHTVHGELWKHFGINEAQEVFSTQDEEYEDFLAEGNYALSISEGAYGKTDLEWNFDDWNFLYEYYRDICKYHDILTLENAQNDIYQKICSGKPFMMARIGNTELSILKEYIEKKEGFLRRYSVFWLEYLYNCCGFFSANGDVNDDDVDMYSHMTLKAMKNCDYHVCWGHESLAAGLNFVLDEYESKDSKRISWDYLDTPRCCYSPTIGENALKGKKVLVISPFTETIKNQYEKREIIYNGENRLPKFDLILYKAPETQMGQTYGYPSWFDIFKRVCEDIERIDFDIALIGAGAYGLPLAYEIKKMGRQAISLSSYLANWFGIKIKRYCAYGKINHNWNNHWVFPFETPPLGYDKIESGCYWR